MKNTNDRLVPLTMDKEKDDLDLYMQRVGDIKNYKDFPEMKVNPFICLVSDEINNVWKPIQSEKNVIQAKNGDGAMITLKDQRVFYRPVHSDNSMFTKIYKRHLKEMFNLTHGSLKLFGYVMNNMSFLKEPDLVYIDMDDAINFCEYGENSRSVIYKSLIELCNKGFICKTDRPWVFFVNPAYAFNGNRVTLVTDYFLKDDDQPADFKSQLKSLDRSPEHNISNDFE